MLVKEKIKALRHSSSVFGGLIYKFFKNCSHLVKLLSNESYRSEYFTQWKHGEKYYQRSFYTEPNRYPRLLKECRDYMNAVPNPQILSFGCSTGEEVFNIGEYLPNANVTGIDINKWCLKQCKKKTTDPRFNFYHRLSNEFIIAGNFDAIFCMAVFQRIENRVPVPDIAKAFTFEQFEREILMIDAKLKHGGLFIIDNADFSFTDTACSIHYKPLDFEKNKLHRHNRPQFDKNNKKVADSQNNYRMFVKQG